MKVVTNRVLETKVEFGEMSMRKYIFPKEPILRYSYTLTVDLFPQIMFLRVKHIHTQPQTASRFHTICFSKRWVNGINKYKNNCDRSKNDELPCDSEIKIQNPNDDFWERWFKEARHELFCLRLVVEFSRLSLD